ncbi:photosystem II biogenesis protein Psp29 [Umezakia ovalisporum]|uniref:Protein Thf1 n=2 Tax=Umezakia ovalisporum TaxID=75695 RepID=A0AA43H064_9CYAN|nr:photosystem II biogenesis protein Psp29 [Umezakia ovalisporum]MBI1242232.1 photosystem II biogenesis protein Psp29 [Nostoc sp. RI_552]MDH6057110.1 photosystem II biogenesis protein Psp29 [Umezakia ovalisporum FSS-43]MDH6065059.1 photosystem II biogenesis protein Psp29 [Umezakia ovalisporum FSS-62]MDH6067158.1 photosystem II biogenesis protein Psp29 [Umezakia ovalisporum APH033B]MDH6071423.1 photosystem II biogenesis protein Psp29 [Umezakia ovalisporum CobakiLakeA]
MNNVRTVSDTKQAFYSLHTRPINTIYRRVVEELMVEMHLLSVNSGFTYNGIYALGVVTTFDRFMQGYVPQRDQQSIFQALCQAMEQDPQRYRQDAERLQALAKDTPIHDLIAWLSQTSHLNRDPDLQAELQAIANNPGFKYNRLFAIGLFTLLENSAPELVKDEKQRAEALKTIAAGLHLSYEKLSKDLELYSSNLEKMAQALIVMADMVSADRKKREQRQQQTSTPVAPPSTNE